MHDVIIIGGGPAGLTAAVYCARQKVRFLMISRDIGGQTLLSSDVENYLGYHFITGQQLVEKFEEHLRDYKIRLNDNESVTRIEKKAGSFNVMTDKGKYESRAVLIATGEKPRKLNVKGEEELYGKGVSYCYTCDAPVFAGKDVAVIGGGNSAMEGALLCEKYSRKVCIITINKELKGEKTLKARIRKSRKIRTIGNAATKEIRGNKFVSSIVLDIKGKQKEIRVEGVFIEVGMIPNSEFADIVEKNRWNEIVTDKNSMTSVPGIFAAGDVADVPAKQIIVAAGEGAKAALSIFRYLSRKQ